MRLSGSVVAVILAGLLAVACGDDHEPAPGGNAYSVVPSPALVATAAPSPTSVACPANPAACDLARLMQEKLAAGDFAAVASLHRLQAFDCPGGPPLGAGGPFPLCDGAAAGEKRSGLQMARRYSEGYIVSPNDYVRILGQLAAAADTASSDQYGPGSLQLYGVGCLDAPCSRFTVIFSWILKPAAIPPVGTVPGREVLVFFAGSQSGQPPIESTWTGVILPGEHATILQQGGTLSDLGDIRPYKGE